MFGPQGHQRDEAKLRVAWCPEPSGTQGPLSRGPLSPQLLLLTAAHLNTVIVGLNAQIMKWARHTSVRPALLRVPSGVLFASCWETYTSSFTAQRRAQSLLTRAWGSCQRPERGSRRQREASLCSLCLGGRWKVPHRCGRLLEGGAVRQGSGLTEERKREQNGLSQLQTSENKLPQTV